MMDAGGHVLVVDDEPNAIRVLSAILGDAGFSVSKAGSFDEAVGVLHQQDLDAVVTDMKMPGYGGEDLYQYIVKKDPDLPVIFLTAYGDVESAVSAMTKGAFYYFIKPPDYANLKSILARAVEQRRLKRELYRLRDQLRRGDNRHAIVGNHVSVQRVLELVESFADSTSSVLVCGETGTGKELVAKALHRFGGRRDRPFVAVNCAAIPRELIEAELFGYEKGAFTGAVSRRTGRIEQAAGGTLFLDEIGELESAVQAKLLRVLQEKEVEMLGGRREVPVDFRLVSSTNRDLAAEVEAGRFREDLYYRINVVQIDVPPLRNRWTDIPLLVESFLREFCSREKKVLTIPASLQDLLQKCPWPGNVRQLRNVIERAVVLARGRELSKHDFPPELFRGLETARHQASGRTLREVEADAIKATLSQCDGNKSRAARILGMSRKALYKRLREFEGLNP